MEIPDSLKQQVVNTIGSTTGVPVPLIGLIFAAAEALVRELLEKGKGPPPPRVLKAKMVDIHDIKDSLLARDVLNPPSREVSALMFLLSESFRVYENEGHFDLEDIPLNLSEKVQAALSPHAADGGEVA
jgi:hypothetical protein